MEIVNEWVALGIAILTLVGVALELYRRLRNTGKALEETTSTIEVMEILGKTAKDVKDTLGAAETIMGKGQRKTFMKAVNKARETFKSVKEKKRSES
jgi:uncharacterized protein YoxC